MEHNPKDNRTNLQELPDAQADTPEEDDGTEQPPRPKRVVGGPNCLCASPENRPRRPADASAINF